MVRDDLRSRLKFSDKREGGDVIVEFHPKNVFVVPLEDLKRGRVWIVYIVLWHSMAVSNLLRLSNEL